MGCSRCGSELVPWGDYLSCPKCNPVNSDNVGVVVARQFPPIATDGSGRIVMGGEEREARSRALSKALEAAGSRDDPANPNIVGVGDAPDMINRPPHYQGSGGLEVFDVAEAFGITANAYLFNVIKYVLRVGRKGPAIDDLRKAAVYLAREISNREKA